MGLLLLLLLLLLPARVPLHGNNVVLLGIPLLVAAHARAMGLAPTSSASHQRANTGASAATKEPIKIE